MTRPEPVVAATARPAEASPTPEPAAASAAVSQAPAEPTPAPVEVAPTRVEAPVAPVAPVVPAVAAAAAAQPEPAPTDKPDVADDQSARSRPAAKKNAKGRRSSVPSWDEIMLGSSRQRD